MAPGCRLALDPGTSNHRGNANRANANMAIKSCAMRTVAKPMRELNRRTLAPARYDVETQRG
jgi:hypothetical protein